MNDEQVRVLTGYARDYHPRVSVEAVKSAITDIENRYGVDFDSDDFTQAMEDEAIALAVDRRNAHEQDWFDGSEDCHV